MTTGGTHQPGGALGASLLPLGTEATVGDLPFEQQAAVVFGNLQQAMADLLAAAPSRTRSAADVSRFFAVDKALGWNAFKMATAPNPMAVGVNLPARVSIDRLLRAARHKNIPNEIVTRVSAAFDQFEKWADEYSDDRSELDTLVVSTLPEEREKTHRNRREAMFCAARDLRGVSLATSLYLVVVHPSNDDPSRLDWTRVYAWIDMRRLNKKARVKVHSYTTSQNSPMLTVDGRAIEDVSDVLLAEFSSEPLPRIAAYKCGSANSVKYALESADVGVRSSITAVFADYIPAYSSRYSTPERPIVGAAMICEHPCRRQIIDLLVCDGVVSAQRPDVRVYDTVPGGHVRFDDHSREDERVDFEPPYRSMGRGLQSFGSPHIPRYQELLAYICRLRGWDGTKLHGHRLEIEYPVYSWQSQLTLSLPEKPEST